MMDIVKHGGASQIQIVIKFSSYYYFSVCIETRGIFIQLHNFVFKYFRVSQQIWRKNRLPNFYLLEHVTLKKRRYFKKNTICSEILLNLILVHTYFSISVFINSQADIQHKLKYYYYFFKKNKAADRLSDLIKQETRRFCMLSKSRKLFSFMCYYVFDARARKKCLEMLVGFPACAGCSIQWPRTQISTNTSCYSWVEIIISTTTATSLLGWGVQH